MRKKKYLKRILPCILATAMIFEMSSPAVAGQEPLAKLINKSEYTKLMATPDSNGFVIEDGVLTGYSGSGGAITIPDTVTKIGDKAFYNNQNVTKVTMGDSVTAIGDSAFEYAKVLTEVVIGKKVSKIDSYAFDCNVTTITLPDVIDEIGDSIVGNALTTLIIPVSGHDYTTTKDTNALEAFYHSKKLTNVVVEVGNTVYSASDGVLFNVDKTRLLKYPAAKTGISYTIPSTVTEIGYKAFISNTNLTSIDIPDGVVKVDASAFEYSEALAKVTIGKGVKELLNYSLSGCNKLTEINLNASIKNDSKNAYNVDYTSMSGSPISKLTIGKDVTYVEEVFYSADRNKLEQIIVNPDNEAYCSVDGILYSKDMKTIVRCPHMKTDTQYTIPASIETIGVRAFQSNNYLTSINITGNVKRVEYGAFEYCKNIESITIDECVTYLGSYALASCGAKTINLNATLKNEKDNTAVESTVISETNYVTLNVGKNAAFIEELFYDYNKYALNTINVDEANTSYKAVDNVLFSKDMKNLIRYPMIKAGTSYTIPATVENIGVRAFKSNNYLTTVVIPDTVKTIGYSAFEYQKEVTSFTIGKGVTKIEEYALASCSKAVELTLNATLKNTTDNTALAGTAVSGTTYTKLNIGKDVTYVEEIFYSDGLPELDTIVVDEANTVYCSADGILFDKDKKTLIKYPRCKMGETYNIPSTVENIGIRAFFSNCEITSIEIPDTVKTIGKSAYEYCNGVTSIKIGKGVTKIDTYALASCGKTVELTLNATLKNTTDNTVVPYSVVSSTPYQTLNIGEEVTYVDGVFYSSDRNCLENIIVDEENTTYSCDSIAIYNKDKTVLLGYPVGRKATNYTIADTVTTIKDRCFYNNDNLINMTIPSSVTTLGKSVFEYASLLEYVEIPDSVKTIGDYSLTSAPQLVIRCNAGSEAEEYAIANNIPYITDKNHVSIALAVKETALTTDSKTVKLGLKDCRYTMYNVTQDKSIKCIAGNEFISITQNVNENDTIKLTITPKNTDIAPKEVTFVTDVYKSAVCGEVILSKKGYITASNIDKEVTMLVYNSEGELYSEIRNEDKIYRSKYLNSGTYKLILSRGNYRLLRRDELSEYDSLGLVAGTDYIVKEITVNDGKITNVDMSQINVPEFSNTNIGLLDYENSSYMITTDAIRVGGLINLRGTYSFKEDKLNDISNVKLRVQIPENVEYITASFTVNGKSVIANDFSESVDDGIRTITVKVSDKSGTFILSVKPTTYTDMITRAAVEFYYENANLEENIGIVNEKTEYVTLNGPSTSTLGSVVLNGVAPVGSNVEIYDGNSKLGSIKTRQSGLWSGVFKLNKSSNVLHKVTAYINKGQEDEQKSSTIDIDYSDKLPSINNITLFYRDNKYTCTVMEPATVTFVPDYNDYKIMLNIDNAEGIDTLKLYGISGFGQKIDMVARRIVGNQFYGEARIIPKDTPPMEFQVYYSPKTSGGVIDPNDAILPFSYKTDGVATGNAKGTSTIGSIYGGLPLTGTYPERILTSNAKEDEERVLAALEEISDIWKDATVTKLDEEDEDGYTERYRVVLADGHNSEVIIRVGVTDGSVSLPQSGSSGTIGSGSTGGSQGSASTTVTSSQLASDPSYTKVQMSSDTYVYVSTSFEQKPTEGSSSESGAAGGSSGSTYPSDSSSAASVSWDVSTSTSVYVEVGGQIVNGVAMEVAGAVFGDAGGMVVGGISLVNDAINITDAYLKMADLEEQIRNDSSLTDSQRQAKLDALDGLRDSYNAYSILKAGLAALTVAGMASVLFTGPVGLVASIAIAAITAALDYMVGKLFEDYVQFLEDFRFNWLIDPSGYIYEGVPSNRLEGVKVTVYERGKADSEELQWDAQEYNQVNPQYTDADGQYGWDVTVGKWKVKAEKSGYQPTQSEWLDVPPVQTEVNLAMISTKKPEVTIADIHPDYAEITFDKYMKVSTVNNTNITIPGVTIAAVTPLNSEKGADKTTDLATRFKVTYSTNLTEGAEYTINVSKNVVNYADLNMESDFSKKVKTASAVSGMKLTGYTDNKITKACTVGEIIEIPVAFEPKDAAAGKKAICILDEWQSDFASVESVSDVDSEGKATVKLKILIPGSINVKVGLEGTTCTSQVALNLSVKDDIKQEPKKFTVTFDRGTTEGADIAPKTLKDGDAYGTLAVPTRTGYSFDGWYTSATGGVKIEAETKAALSANQTLYAHWSAIKVTVAYDKNGGSSVSMANAIYTYDTLFGLLPTASKTGYVLDGWYTAKTGGSKITAESAVKFTADTKLYAQWKNATYKVSFEANGGKVSTSSKTVSYAGTYGSLPSATRSGYSFAGWYTTKTGGTKVTSSTAVKITKAITLYARYSYKVAFDKNGGKVSTSSKTVYCQQKYGTLPKPTKSGYIFAGWYTKKTGGSLITDKSTVGNTKVTKLYARWAKSYTVKFDKNGGKSVTKSSMSVGYGLKYGTLPTAKRAGYTFSGWYTAKKGGSKITALSVVKIKKTTTLYARWSKVSVSKANIKSLTSKSKNMAVTLSKVSGAKGYEITYATNTKFTTGKKTVSVTSVSKNITSLVKGKKYYVRVRAYKLDSMGKKVYGAYSAVKNVKVK